MSTTASTPTNVNIQNIRDPECREYVLEPCRDRRAMRGRHGELEDVGVPYRKVDRYRAGPTPTI